MSKRTAGKRRPKTGRAGGRDRASGRAATAREWVGGRMRMSAYVGGEAPFRPELMVWLELPEELVLGQAVVDPRDPDADLGHCLLATMAAPLVGRARRPQRVRVATAALAHEVRAAAPDLEVVVAPTPELDALLADLNENLDARDDEEVPSYLDHGADLAPDLVRLFRAAARLHPCEPWQLLDEQEALRIDIPALGLEAGCVTTFGRLAESIGFAVFPSLVSFERFLSSMQAHMTSGRDTRPEGPFFSLLFVRGAELPDAMRREVAEHGWSVAGPHAYPLPAGCDADGMPAPLTARERRILTACAGALAAFCDRHRERLEHRSDDADYGIERIGESADGPEPITESFHDDDGIEVRLTLPYDPRRETPAITGAGRLAAQDPVVRARALHDLDRGLVDALFAFASRQWAPELRTCIDSIEGTDHNGQLYPHVALHDMPIGRGRRTLAQRFFAANERRLSPPERAWLTAQQRAWLSVWEVTAVRVGDGVSMQDRFTGERREVIDVSVSRVLSIGHALLGRVVDHAGLSVLCGSHPRSLSPLAAGDVERRLRIRARRRYGPMAVDKLREPRLIRHLCALWEEIAKRGVEDRARPQELRNTDGDPLLLTVDHFTFEAGQCEALAERLCGLDGFEPVDADDEQWVFDVTRPGNAMHQSWDNTIVGRVQLARDRLRVESNSVARADRLRERIETVCEGVLRHRGREHSDPLAHRDDVLPGAAPDETPPPELAELIRSEKARHYASWAATPLPALGGKTPREAVRSAAGREQVALLLRECEHIEARQAEGVRFDVNVLRRELGLER